MLPFKSIKMKANTFGVKIRIISQQFYQNWVLRRNLSISLLPHCKGARAGCIPSRVSLSLSYGVFLYKEHYKSYVPFLFGCFSSGFVLVVRP